MNKSKAARRSRKTRKGAVAALTALVLLAILGVVAIALDIGYIEMTRTQLQSAADASALAAASELMPGFGYKKTKTRAQVETAAKPVAVEYAGYNRNAEQDATFINDDRDIELGRTIYDNACQCWTKTPASSNPAYYNYVEVSPLRNQTDTDNGDSIVPLFFSRILGYAGTAMRATSTAAQLQANGFRVPPGSGDTVDMIPFAISKQTWEKMQRAQVYYNANPNVFANTTNPFASNYIGRIMDPAFPTQRLFGRGSLFLFRQEFFDSFTRTDAGVVTGSFTTRVPDGKLEINVIDWESVGEVWNFGTIEVGSTNPSWNHTNDQIEDGISESDMNYYSNNQFVASLANPMIFSGQFDIFLFLQVSAFNSVRGQCKAMALYRSATGNFEPNYTVDQFVAASVMGVRVQLFIFVTDIRIQPCKLVENNALADKERPIDDNSTLFTPLTLIR